MTGSEKKGLSFSSNLIAKNTGSMIVGKMSDIPDCQLGIGVKQIEKFSYFGS